MSMGIPGDKDGVGFTAGLVEANEWNGFWEDTGRGAQGVADDAGAVRCCEAEWKASFARRFWSKRLAVEYQASMSSSSGRSCPDSAILSWITALSPQRNLTTMAIASVYPETSMRLSNSSM